MAMNNFKPGGIRHRSEHIGGRPKSDGDYRPKRRFDTSSVRRDERGGGRGDNKEVQLYKATCTTCGKSCEVPFKPNGTKPVLCRDCFASKNPAPAQNTFTRSETTPRPENGALKAQLAALEAKVERIIELLEEVTKKVTNLAPQTPKVVNSIEVAKSDEVVATKTPKTKAKAEKKTVKKTVKKTKAK